MIRGEERKERKPLVVPPEVKLSVEKALAQLWRTSPLDRWAGGTFIQSTDELTLFLRKCGDAYIRNDKNFFIELGKVMRKKRPETKAPSTASANDTRTFLLVHWAGVEFVESILTKYSVDASDLEGFPQLKTFVGRGLIPLCFYSDSALCQLNNEILRFRQVSEGNMKQIRLRLGLKRPPGSSLVKRVELQDQKFIQHLRQGTTVTQSV
jgi:hypothetical protein